MTQIFCLECKKQVSERASVCPHCACPIDSSIVAAAATAAAATAKDQAIKIANEKFKSMQLMSSITLGVSLLVLSSTPGETGNGMWVALSAAGSAGLIYASVGIWLKRR
jgi:uncharacterized protein YfiM (DUF2279 family)